MEILEKLFKVLEVEDMAFTDPEAEEGFIQTIKVEELL